MHMYLFVRDNTWAGLSNPRAGPRNYLAGSYGAVSRVPSCYVMDRAEPGLFENVMGWAGPRPIV